MRILTLIAVVALVATTHTFAEETKPLASVSSSNNLVQQLSAIVGADRKDYVRQFSLESVAFAPKLTMAFSPLQKGSCLVTYRHTELWLNKRLIKQIDFRKMVIGASQSLTIDIPRGALKIGENLLEISFGSCQYGIDVMRLDSLKIDEN